MLSPNINLPTYPDFKSVEITDQSLVNEFFSRYKPYCDFSFTNIYIWEPKFRKSKISLLNGNLVLESWNILSNNPEFSVIGESDLQETLDILLSNYECLSFVPSVVIDALDQNTKQSLVIKEDPDAYDYIISTTEMSTLSGNKYSWKRRDINRLKKLDLKVGAKSGTIENSLIKDIDDLYHRWINQKKQKNINMEVGNELIAFENYIKEPLLHKNRVTTYIYDGAKLVSFSFNELVHNRYVLALFAKSDYNYPGINAYNELITSTVLRENGYDYINFEEDLGIETLRNYKMALNPVNFLKKYKVNKKQLW